ncbi:LysO family transporter [Desulfoluna sp.]|uniref:LysO family transporter n=1 Tax=Desulfoluna sp. TaxID=2045199 RepID=UPI00261E81EC|nr:LysO family transporter [Desulfoluna sp.]
MIEILVIMAAGMMIGYLLRQKKALFAALDRVVMAVIFLLLFVLGISVGLNETVVGNIHMIGVKAVVLTFGAVAGSILCCRFAWGLFPATSFQEKTFEREATDEG